MVHYDTLLQNMTDIIAKYDNYFIIKCNKGLLQNSSGALLQNVTVITKCVGTSHLQQSDVLKSENIHGTRIRKTLEDHF